MEQAVPATLVVRTGPLSRQRRSTTHVPELQAFESVTLHGLARVLVSIDRDAANGNYDGPPLPVLVLAFRDHDAGAACFDEEPQHMLEASSDCVFERAPLFAIASIANLSAECPIWP